MKRLLYLLLLLVFPYILWAQTTKKISIDSLENNSPLGEVTDTVQTDNFFGTDIPLEMTLKYDISAFVKNKQKGEYLDAELQVNYKDKPVTKNIRIKARGNFRRGQCAFPPLFLNFKTDSIENTELKGMKKIKIVTHCSSSKNNENYIFKEYLAYKLYNVLTDKSFRVRLLDLSYIDTGKKQKNYRQHGFIIEPIELVVKRTESVEIDPMVVRAQNIVEEDADRVAFFRYMIADTDWRFKSGHNMKYMKSLKDVTDKVIAVPYDFDFSGFVGTNYSFPQEWATTCENITDREYLGYCRNNDEYYLKTIALYNDKKEELLDTIADFEYITEKEKEYLLDFINEFYSEINDPRRFINTLKNQCRNDEF
jgi:hypothetical protein